MMNKIFFSLFYKFMNFKTFNKMIFIKIKEISDYDGYQLLRTSAKPVPILMNFGPIVLDRYKFNGPSGQTHPLRSIVTFSLKILFFFKT